MSEKENCQPENKPSSDALNSLLDQLMASKNILSELLINSEKVNNDFLLLVQEKRRMAIEHGIVKVAETLTLLAHGAKQCITARHRFKNLAMLDVESILFAGEAVPEEYYSCVFLDGNIMFGHDYIGFCCVPHTSPDKGNVTIGPFSGGDIPLDLVFSTRAKLRLDNNRPGCDTRCTGCPFLTKKNWRKKFAFDRLVLAHIALCNLRCSYCGVPTSSPQTYDVMPILNYLDKHGFLANDTYVEMAGGEPGLFKEFEEIMQFILKRKMFVQMASNATIYSESVKAALTEDRLTLCTSIDSGSRESFKRIRGKDLYDQVWENLGRYAAVNKRRVEPKYIIMDENSGEPELLGFVEKCVEKGMAHFVISRDVRKYRNSTLVENAFPEQLLNAVIFLAHEAAIRGLAFHFSHFTDKEMIKVRVEVIRKLMNKDLVRYQDLIKKIMEEIK
ncbi:MAG: radical SAM protein [Verrucomicrobiae bacterium]|nr:radical SAM protein [Verrucomicrobiae bacterium]